MYTRSSSRFSLCLALTIFAVTMAQAQQATQIAKIDNSLLKQQVTVTGKITSFSPSRSARAPNSFQVQDSSGQIRLAIWPDVFDAIPFKASLAVGAEITVKAEVAEFRGALEIHCNAAGDISFASAGTDAAALAPSAQPVMTSTLGPQLVSVGSITKGMVGKEVQVRARVLKYIPSSAERVPYRSTISDGTGEITLVYWADIATQFKPEQTVSVGAQLEVTAEVSEYQNNLQLRVRKPENLRILGSLDASAPAQAPTGAAAPAASSSAPQASAPASDAVKATVASLNEASLGKSVQISGTIDRATKVSGGTLLTVKDDTGSITVPVWDSSVGNMLSNKDKLVKGSKITVNGELKKYNDKLEIVPSGPQDIVNLQ